ncbi:Gfo/Idh/MocA family protein [Plantactinospora sp. WMMC1484]|uniref:Gfo/Idh/MocA family protein n=1 Tax=Plantactinospora sp. WMMC1484 TaxID=3404122 RepID=UPI003BF6104F
MSPTGVGIIGVGGWASQSHIPVITASPDYALRAVSTSRRTSAAAAGERLGVAAYHDHRELLAHPGIELVVVAARVTQHVDLIEDALKAGKGVYSEWPLANGLAQATRLAELARTTRARTVVGLQGRFAPEVRYARDLIRDGYVGEVLGTTMVGSGMVWGGRVATRQQAYWFDNTAGATLLTSAVLHALDPLHTILGEFASVTANLVVSRKEATVVEDGSTIAVTAPDQVGLVGTLESGAAASVFYRGGASRGDNFRWEINGTDGDLVLTAGWGNVQVAQLTLAGGRNPDTTVMPLEVPSRYTSEVPAGLAGTPADGVARLYDNLARGLPVPDFEHALTRHRLIDAIERSSASGSRVVLAERE